MKKILSVIAAIAILNNCVAQIPPIRIPKAGANKDAVNQGGNQVPIGAVKKDEQKILPIVQLDAGIVAATESIMAKMKEVVVKANGFKDDKLTEVFNSIKVKGYYRNTNGANGVIYYNTARKKSVFIYGDIRKFYDSQGGSNSYIDYPVNDATILKPITSTNITLMYTIQAIDKLNGCVGYDSMEVKSFSTIYVPNAFTPNADNKNDRWLIPALEAYPNCTVIIYNRYGEKIFQSKGYTKPWDGKFKGLQQPTGAYVYTINAGDGILKLIQGMVMIVR